MVDIETAAKSALAADKSKLTTFLEARPYRTLLIGAALVVVARLLVRVLAGV